MCFSIHGTFFVGVDVTIFVTPTQRTFLTAIPKGWSFIASSPLAHDSRGAVPHVLCHSNLYCGSSPSASSPLSSLRQPGGGSYMKLTSIFSLDSLDKRALLL